VIFDQTDPDHTARAMDAFDPLGILNRGKVLTQ